MSNLLYIDTTGKKWDRQDDKYQVTLRYFIFLRFLRLAPNPKSSLFPTYKNMMPQHTPCTKNIHGVGDSMPLALSISDPDF